MIKTALMIIVFLIIGLIIIAAIVCLLFKVKREFDEDVMIEEARIKDLRAAERDLQDLIDEIERKK